jgi:hypothetical protein
LFVVTKFDRCPPPTLAELGAPDGAPAGWTSAAREAVGARILDRYLPATGRFLAGTADDHGPKVADPLWFFSSLQIVPEQSPPRIVIRSRVPVGGWEPEYPFEEYRSLIEHLGKLAHGRPDPAENT